MHLLSDIRRDARHPKSRPGSYEWWYFDGISEDGDYQVVIIFYEGCPFSTRYIRSLEKDPEGEDARADRHPAISISLYHKGEPIFYCLSEYPPEQCSFDETQAAVTVGENSFRFSERETHGSDGFGSYDIRLNERLPSGDELKGILTFSGMDPNERLFSGKGKAPGKVPDNVSGKVPDSVSGKLPGMEQGASVLPSASASAAAGPASDTVSEDGEPGHLWNLVMPRANMQCRINMLRNGLIAKELKFEGEGYHDHNLGSEPMKETFRDWYWGRVHFPQGTLVYYIMNKNGKDGGKKWVQDYRAWLISPDNRRLLYTMELAGLERRSTNSFLLRPARRLQLKEKELEIEVRHKVLADSGPFYCRYISEAKLTHPALEPQKSTGIAEYIRPDRIHRRLFWPLVHMRLRYVDQKPHWVQKSPRLFRWTW